MKPIFLLLAAAMSVAAPGPSARAGDAVVDLRADGTSLDVRTARGGRFRGSIFGDDHDVAVRVGRGGRLHLFAGPCPFTPRPADVDVAGGTTSIVVVPCR